MFDNQMHVVNYASGDIEEDGIFEIQKLLIDHGIELPLDWSWTVNVPKGEYCGSFVKRVRKFAHKNKIKLDNEFWSSLGSIVGQHSTKNTKYNFRLTQNDWQRGDFADPESCFWTDRYYCRSVLKKENFGAIQFFEDDLASGIGRAWVGKIKNDIVVFNAYGIPLLTITRILSQHLNLLYKKVDLCNNGSADDYLYINQGIGYILYSDVSKHNDTEEFDLKINFAKYMCKCKNCESEILKEEILCSECKDLHKNCSKCNELVKEFLPHTTLESISSITIRATNFYCVDCYLQEFAELINS